MSFLLSIELFLNVTFHQRYRTIANQQSVPPSNPMPNPKLPNEQPNPADTIEDIIQNTDRISKCNSILLLKELLLFIIIHLYL